MTSRVLITGAGAQLAGALLPEFAGTGEIRALGHADLDITDHAAVGRMRRGIQAHADRQLRVV